MGSLALSATRVVLSEGDSVVLTASVDPAWATDKVVEWRTSDAQVALVSAEGRVVAVGVGEAIVSAIARDESGVKAECAVKVLPRNDRHREGGFSAGR